MPHEPRPLDRLLRRRGFLRLLAGSMGLAAAMGITACEPKRPLKIAAQMWPGYAFLFLASDNGIVSAKHVELIETDNLAHSSKLLLEGRVDGAALTLDEVLHLLEQGVSLRVVLVLDSSAGGDVVLAKPDVKNLAQLAGKRIGVENSTLGAVMLAKLLEAAGLKPQQLQKVDIGLNHFDEFQRHQLDAIITYTPNTLKFENDGMVNVFDSRSIPNTVIDVLAVRDDAFHDHDVSIIELIAGHFQAQELWKHQPIDTVYGLAKLLRIKSSEVKDAYHGLDLPDVTYNRHLLAAPAAELKTNAESIARIMQSHATLARIPDLSQLFIADYLP